MLWCGETMYQKCQHGIAESVGNWKSQWVRDIGNLGEHEDGEDEGTVIIIAGSLAVTVNYN